MKRLTYKNYIEEYEVNFEKSSDKSWSIAESDTHIKVTGEPVNKLGELEDILESWHIGNLEELKIRLHDCQVYHLQNNSNETLIHNLKNELSDLQHRLEVAEKALELACIECAFFDYSKTENWKAKQKRFIKQAEKELKGDVGE